MNHVSKRGKKGMIILVVLLATITLFLIMLPTILQWMGLHPDYKGEQYNLAGKSVLVVTTSHNTLGDTGKATGVYASEMTIPYYEFIDANMTVDVASIQGGEIPFEPMSLRYPLITSADKRYLKDDELQHKVKNSLKIDDVDINQYDMVYMAGGWGAAYDLGQSKELGEKITQANANGSILGSVCHGALGFLQAKETNGDPLVKGKTMTAVTDKQIQELKITQTPLHPETELRNSGANFVSNTAFKDFFATDVAIDRNIVTGQNQNSGSETAQYMMLLLQEGVQ